MLLEVCEVSDIVLPVKTYLQHTNRMASSNQCEHRCCKNDAIFPPQEHFHKCLGITVENRGWWTSSRSQHKQKRLGVNVVESFVLGKVTCCYLLNDVSQLFHSNKTEARLQYFTIRQL